MLDGMIWRFGLSRISLAINSQCYIGSIATARDPCRSRVVVNGNRRVNYYLKHLLVAARRAAVDVPLRAMQTCGTEDEHGKFSNASCFNRLLCPPRILQRVQAMSCIVKLQDPEIAIHPILVQLGDLVWKPCLQGRQWQFPPLVHARGRVCNDLMSTCIHGLRNDLVYWRFLRGLLTKSVCFSRSLSLSLQQQTVSGHSSWCWVCVLSTGYGSKCQHHPVREAVPRLHCRDLHGQPVHAPICGKCRRGGGVQSPLCLARHRGNDFSGGLRAVTSLPAASLKAGSFEERVATFICRLLGQEASLRIVLRCYP